MHWRDSDEGQRAAQGLGRGSHRREGALIAAEKRLGALSSRVVRHAGGAPRRDDPNVRLRAAVDPRPRRLPKTERVEMPAEAHDYSD